MVIGSAGPTTAGRMDAYTPYLLSLGVRGFIGKGKRNAETKEAFKKYRGIYFAAIGGAAAYLSKTIRKAEIIAYPELGTEAIRRLEVEDFPAYVIHDIHGGDLYAEESPGTASNPPRSGPLNDRLIARPLRAFPWPSGGTRPPRERSSEPPRTFSERPSDRPPRGGTPLRRDSGRSS